MVTQNRDELTEKVQRVIKPSAKLFFINKDLIRVLSSNRGQNIIYMFNLTKNKEQSMLLSDFKKHKKRAYTVIDTCRLLNKSPSQIRLHIRNGFIDPPTGVLADGERSYTRKSYYSEDQIFAIRDALSTIHIGRPRKDGKVSNSMLTEQELRARMGDALVLYTRTKDGNFIPVWAEETY